MKLLRLLTGYALYDHKTNDSIRRELQTDSILDKTDEYRRNWLLHLQRMPQNSDKNCDSACLSKYTIL
jgi:hypothetical protein